MIRIKGPNSILRMILASALALASASVSAQDAGSYQLPPAPTQTAAAQGPVVPDVPPPRVEATSAPVPAVKSPPPVIAVPSPPATERAAPPARQSPPPRATTAAMPSASPKVVPAAPMADIPSALPPVASPSATLPPEISPPKVAPSQDAGFPWAWLGFALVVAVTAGGAVHWRRRKKYEPSATFEPPVVQRPTPAAEPVATGQMAKAPPPLALDLVAVRMSASLVNATLAYRVILTAGEDVAALVLRGDMTSAHASRPTDEQLGADNAPVLHRPDHLAKGETHELKGEIRLPLAAITPIRHGSAALFVPLVRIEVEGSVAGRPIKLRAAFVIGLEDLAAGPRLQPFRLDLGPRVYSDIGQRALTVPAFA